MNELKGVGLGIVGGVAVGRALGIGMLGTLMGAFAGAVAGYWLASVSGAGSEGGSAIPAPPVAY